MRDVQKEHILRDTDIRNPSNNKRTYPPILSKLRFPKTTKRKSQKTNVLMYDGMEPFG